MTRYCTCWAVLILQAPLTGYPNWTSAVHVQSAAQLQVYICSSELLGFWRLQLFGVLLAIMFGHLFKRQYESVATEEGYVDEYSAVPMSDMKADFTSCSTHARRTGDYERQGSGRSSWAWSLAGLLTLLNVALSCWSTTVFFIQPRLGKYLPHIAHNNMDAHHGKCRCRRTF